MRERAIAFGRWVAVFTLAGLVLRCMRLGHQSLWIDEILTYSWLQEIDKRGLGSLIGNIHGPLYTAVVWLWSRAGHGEAWLRVPSVLASAATVPLLGLWVRRLWGERAGAAAAALAAVSPFALYYAQELRNYAFTMLFATASCIAVLRYRERPTVRRMAAVGLSELAGILSNLNGLFFAIGLGVWALVALRRHRRALLGFCAGSAVLVAVLVPYAWEITHQVRPERLVGVETGFGSKEPLRGETTLHPLALPYTAYAFAAGYSLGPTLEELRANPRSVLRVRHAPALGLVALGFGLPFLTGLVRMRRGRLIVWIPSAVVAGWVVWLAATNVKPFNVRYLSVLFPAFLGVTAAGWALLPGRVRGIAGAAALAAALWSSANYLFVPRYGRDDARGAIAYVAAHADSSDTVVQISLTATARYYYRALGDRPVHPPASATEDPGHAAAYLRELVPGTGTVWYLECREPAIDPRGLIRKALMARATDVEIREFTGVRVHRYELGAPE